MAPRIYTSVFLVILACLTCSSYGYQFNVGGRNGWTLNPSENYNHWAERMRFQVNDTLVFKYKKGSDSVLVVNKDDYDKCNTNNPILKLEDGNSIFKFDRSGPFYFISGNKQNCDQGQKMIILVMAVRPPPPSPPHTGQPPAASPPKGSSTSPSKPPAAPPTAARTPSGSPTTSPTPAVPPVMSPSPVITPPASSPPPAVSPSPETSGQGPSPASIGQEPSPAGTAPSPTSSPPSSAIPLTPEASTPAAAGGPGAGISPPADNTTTGGATPERSFAAPAFTPSNVVVLTVSSAVLMILG